MNTILRALIVMLIIMIYLCAAIVVAWVLDFIGRIGE